MQRRDAMNPMREKIKVLSGGKDGGKRKPPGGGRFDPDDWRSRLTRTDKGHVQASMHNLVLILEHDEAVRDLFALNEFAQRIVLRRTPPWPTSPSREFTEVDAGELAAWLGSRESYELNARTGAVIEAVEIMARRQRFHPVREYLHGLTWDGTERIPRMFAEYFGTRDDAYHAQTGLVFLIGAVARIETPGCKVDHMLVLEGKQGAGKTRAVRELFGGDEWYMDAQRSPAEKDFYQDIVGKWGVEIGEMVSFSKADYNKIKQTLTAQADTYRPSYGRFSRTFPRQCVIVGTTNDNTWQRDPSGGRRFLPVRVGAVDVAGLVAIRDALWAEALARYRRGESWWQLPERAEEEQDARYLEDSWSDPIQRWLSGKASAAAYEDLPRFTRHAKGHIVECTTTEILSRALHIDIPRHEKNSQMRVAEVMRSLGWDKHRARKRGSRKHRWFEPEGWTWEELPNET